MALGDSLLERIDGSMAEELRPMSKVLQETMALQFAKTIFPKDLRTGRFLGSLGNLALWDARAPGMKDPRFFPKEGRLYLCVSAVYILSSSSCY